MNNSRITAKERNLVRGAIRRAFSRSELRLEVMRAAIVHHVDPKRKRVKTWYKCQGCSTIDAGFKMVVDHKVPVIPVDSALEHMSWDDFVNNMWCDKNNLQMLCLSCHTNKTKEEQKARKEYRKKNVK